jgi:5'-methylthioadenosine phosphorylase
MVQKYVGLIGGSGLYKMDGMEITEERVIHTPFGETSDKMMLGKLDGVPVAFMPRHGRGHMLNPSEVNYRANIYAFKTLGVDKILSVSAVGSMKEELDRGHIVIVDQFIDWTRSRPYTFFENGIVAHLSFAEPICSQVSKILYDNAIKTGATVQKGGTYICIEGPMFSSRAESNLFRSWGVDVIGMTNYQEAKFALEAEICYSTMAMITDYDCWHEFEEDVDALSVLKVMAKNVEVAQKILRAAVPQVQKLDSQCACNSALNNGIVTDHKLISAETKERLGPIIGKYIK